MLNSKKIAAAAGVLGSFALISVGAGQAFADASPGKCVSYGKDHVRCTEVSNYKLTTDKRGNITVVNHSTQTCPTSHSRVTCVSSVDVPGKKS